MLSEHFDIKIREAADRHHPAYDEKAWKKMRRLLDKYLPEEKRKKRGFFFLLLFLILAGGAAWVLLNPPFGKGPDKSVVSTATKPGPMAPTTRTPNEESLPVDPGATGPANNRKDRGGAGTGSVSEDHTKTNPVEITTGGGAGKKTRAIQPEEKDQAPDISFRSTKEREIRKTKSGNPDNTPAGKDHDNKGSGVPVMAGTDPKPGTRPVDEARDVSQEKAVPAGQPTIQQKTDKPVAAQPAVEKKEVNAPVAASENKKAEEKTIKNQKPDKPPIRLSKKKSSFFFSVSGGPDVSYTGQDKMGRLKLFGGAGVGYSYRDRFVIRTGFYTARKLYTSSPEEYHAPPAFYTYYPNLQKVEADCKVYEIPVTLAYNVSGNDRYKFFVSAGLSSYLMKRETYDFYYKHDVSGPLVHKQRTLRNKNDHIFSVINISAGYQQKIGRRFSVVAEPYFKVPVGGVGFAKVNLISTGVQFSITASPFGKPGAGKPGKTK